MGAAVAAVTGNITLVGGGREVADAVVSLEPVEEPRPTPAPAAAPAPARGVATAPRDSTRLLWGAVRELGALTRDLGARVSALRPGAPPAPAAPPPRTPTLAAIDSAATGLVAGAPVAAAPTPTIPTLSPAAAAMAAATSTRGEILMRQKTFLPHVRVVPSGGSVAWPNRDPFSHNVFSNTPGGTFDLGLYPRGESRAAPFRRAGVYAVFCNIHPRMSAYVVSVPTPYYAQPGPDGRFTIPAVPAGRYRLRVWHERAPEQVVRPLTVTASGAPAVTVALDVRDYRPQAHTNKFGQPYARPARDEY